MGTFDELVKRVGIYTSEEKAAHSIALALQEATAKMHDYSLVENLPIVRDDNPNFDLMSSFGLIDYKRTSIVIKRRSSITATMEGPHYWFLSQRAIRLHRDLAYEGYYGHDPEGS